VQNICQSLEQSIKLFSIFSFSRDADPEVCSPRFCLPQERKKNGKVIDI
jgi:hypothetical protein